MSMFEAQWIPLKQGQHLRDVGLKSAHAQALRRDCSGLSIRRCVLGLQLTFTSSTLPTAHSFLNHASASCSSNKSSTPLGLLAIFVSQLVYCGYSKGERPDTSTLGGRGSSLEEEESAAAVDAEGDIALEVAAGHGGDGGLV